MDSEQRGGPSEQELVQRMKDHDAALVSGTPEDRKQRVAALQERLNALNDEFSEKDPEGGKPGARLNAEGERILREMTAINSDMDIINTAISEDLFREDNARENRIKKRNNN